MIGAVDIGGTKTLVAVFSNDGKIIEQTRFETSQDYRQFLQDLQQNVDNLATKDLKCAGVAVPGRLHRETGRALGYGTLRWKAQSVQSDIEKILKCPSVIENDAKVAGFSEAKHISKKYHDVLYVTLGTGISCALITNGVVNPSLEDSEGGQILVEFRGKMTQWEDVVSGRSIVERFGKRASDIDDIKTWKLIAHDIALGLIDLIAVIQPEIVIIGGGIGTHFSKYGKLVIKELAKYETPLVPIPPIVRAKHPEEAVIYGCYELAKARYGRINK